MIPRTVGLLLTLGILAAPLAADAQAAGKVYRIGRLGITNPVAARHGIDAWRQALRERGWVEGHNLVIEFRWAEGKLDRLPALASELVALKVDLLWASSDPGALAAKHATATIPIVMVGVSDPVAAGLVPSLARPGGNLTGLTWDPGPDVIGKELELLKEAVPAASRVAVLWDPDFPGTAPYWTALRTAASRLGVQLQSVETRRAADLDAAFGAILRQGARAVLVFTTPISYSERARLAALALQHRLPTMFDIRENVEAGGLMAYAVNLTDLDRRSAYYVDRILRGARPADLPIEQPTKFELVINLKTAKALGLTIPQSLLLRADELIR
ncbi:MAG: ABC transporter substrate-binding protein [Candidatus Rokubacteria bacterium]|nr:ABC transporter substrate-binding protein [Candidatus Rokubacteria bacterium]